MTPPNWEDTFQDGQTFEPKVIDRLKQLGSSGVQSVSAADSSITIGGTASDPTIAVAGGGASSFVDLGTVSYSDVLAGPHTVYTPAAGTSVQVFVDWPNVTYLDQGGSIHIGWLDGILSEPDPVTFENFDVPLALVNTTTAGASFINTIHDNKLSPNLLKFGLSTGSPIVAALVTDINLFTVLSTPPAWQANHLYAPGTLILDPGGHYQSANVGGVSGTSGGSIPTFATVYDPDNGGSTVDNTVTWTDEGHAPTAGSFRVYALVVGT